jgi:hypothetical protein
MLCFTPVLTANASDIKLQVHIYQLQQQLQLRYLQLIKLSIMVEYRRSAGFDAIYRPQNSKYNGGKMLNLTN